MSTFTGSLLTEWLPDGKNWKVLKSFEFHSGRAASGLFARVDEGFITDLASIPFGVRWLIPKAGKNAQAAVVNDEEATVPISRAMADSMMYQAMRALKVRGWRREMIYRGLQVGGWVRWRELRAADIGEATDTTR